MCQDRVGETNIRNKEEKDREERICVGVQDESGMMMDGFCGNEDLPGSVFP